MSTFRLKNIVVLVSLCLSFMDAFPQKDARVNYLMQAQEKWKYDSLIHQCILFEPEDCMGILLPVYLITPNYSGYILTTVNDFENVLMETNKDILIHNADDMFEKCILGKDTLRVDSASLSPYVAMLLKDFVEIKELEHPSTPRIQNREQVKSFFSSGDITTDKFPDWPNIIYQVFQCGFVTFFYRCEIFPMTISLLDPIIFEDLGE